MELKFKKLDKEAIKPKYQTKGAAGFDLHALEDVDIHPGDTVLVKTGLSFEVPEGYELQVRPRSGLSLKTKLRVANSPGTIDSDYRGPCGVILYNAGSPEVEGIMPADEVIKIKKGDRIAQAVLAPVTQAKIVEVYELSETERGTGGLGSTGL